ncbi:hypothetical protein BCY91_13745 [Pelobium manganitolerans]|uniref:Uncharacterized protein n=1 Tax=Pelobium manganitolerans TaxID=1842495 RepID=A0A419S9P1_9SPHI|nr:hypothetical protein [Pelobium manganitolerans]RKD18942.1 hypothetical protein BCY91_13745 [Pelobium manganitolerans]
MKDFLNKYLVKTGLYHLKKEIKKIRRSSASVSLKAARYVGILVNVENQKQLQEVQKVAAELQTAQKKVRLLAFTSNKSLQANANTNFQLISTKDVNWDLTPKREKIMNFVNNEFDILINLCTEFCFPLLYVAALSKSLFKVAAYDKKSSAFYDFMLATEQQSISGFSAELKYYLDKIK